MATTLSQEWLPNLRFIVKYSENQPILAIFALPRVANITIFNRNKQLFYGISTLFTKVALIKGLF